MAQHDYVIDDGPGLAVRTDMNAAIQAMVTQNSGPIEPITKYAGMMWLDTAAGANGSIKMRNLANTAWTFPSIYGDDRVGEVATFARATPPVGWLKANGAAVSRTTYAALFAAIGTQFGIGDGSTTFNLPDLRGQFVRGWDDGRGLDPSRAFGSAQTDAVENHTHTATTTVASGGAHAHALSSATAASAGAHTHTVSGTAASAGSHTHGSSPLGLLGYGAQGVGGGVGNVSDTALVAGGAHTHTVSGTAASAGAHTHSVTGSTDTEAAHTHTATTTVATGGGGTETRPTNVSLLICIRYA